MKAIKIRYIVLFCFGIFILISFLGQRKLFANFDKVKGVELILVTTSQDSIKSVFIECSKSYFSIEDSIHYPKNEIISIIRFD